MSVLVRNCWLVPFLPLLGGLVAALGGNRLKEKAHLPVALGIGLAFLYSLGLLFSADHPGTTVVYDWINVTGLTVPVEFRVDGLTTMMLSMVTFVATLVVIFAGGYMHGDPGYTRFFAIVGLFVASMTGLVLSSHFILTYAFWEGVGVCSYLLIGFWYSKPSAAAAAKKAFMVNRLGDIGFAIAIFWMWSKGIGHNLSYDSFLGPENLAALATSDKVGIALLLFWAATAKSAQVPLYVWLPDAMEGPTPVSALIHAATMVTAGVYLIARTSLLVAAVPGVQLLICITGCVTALLAAAIALTQVDLKRVMAYSTVSQLGFMFMALGAGFGSVARLAVVAAMFHLFTHAFFKALLFLASGSVMHAMGGVIDMRRFSGLRHKLPITHWTFLVGGLSLSGIFPLAGFWSKDEILAALNEASKVASEAGLPGYGMTYAIIYWTALFTAFLTAFYTGRAYFLTFWGPEKLPGPDDPEAEPVDAHGHGHDDAHDAHDSHIGHESPTSMTYPLIVLAFCTVVVGLAFGPTHMFEHHLLHTPGFETTLGHPEHAHGTDWQSVILGSIAGLAGFGLSYPLYGKRSPVPAQLATRFGGLYRASFNKFRVDEAYTALVIGPTAMLASIAQFFDTYVIDTLVSAVSWVPRLTGRFVLGPYQNGLIQFYAAVTAFGVAGLLFLLLLY
jgi:NADH-quinone oxidoreductase subunit L